MTTPSLIVTPPDRPSPSSNFSASLWARSTSVWTISLTRSLSSTSVSARSTACWAPAVIDGAKRCNWAGSAAVTRFCTSAAVNTSVVIRSARPACTSGSSSACPTIVASLSPLSTVALAHTATTVTTRTSTVSTPRTVDTIVRARWRSAGAGVASSITSGGASVANSSTVGSGPSSSLTSSFSMCVLPRTGCPGD